jgi:ABC-2 type transport system permease protein
MTMTSARAARRIDAGGAERTFTGTAVLLRLMLRRDRVKLPSWILGITLFWLYYTRLVPSVYATEEDLRGISGLLEGPMGRLFTGPAYGFDQLTHDRFIVGAYGLFALVLAALMSILLVVRHTRVEEQTGRAELLRANVVGRLAPLTAALLLAVIANSALAVMIAGIMATAPVFTVGGSILFAAGVGATGLAFAGLSAVTAQATEFSRAAAGLAGGGLGAAFVLRALGDMTSEHGSLVSWLSPLAWPQQTAPFVLDRWWPLALSVAFVVATTACGYALAARRDVGASMFAVRPGPPHAASWLRSPFTLALRLQRAGIVGWTVALALTGLLYGAWTDALLTALDDLPDVLLDVMGGREDIVAGYLGLMALFMAWIVCVYAILAVQGLRGEETAGRAEPVLAAPVSRWGWFGTNIAVTVIGVVVMLTVTGAATGLGAAIVTGDAAHVWELTAAHLAYAPAVALVLAVAALLFGVAPRFIALTWVVLGYALIVGLFGPLMDLPSWAFDLSPFEHVARMPVEAFAIAPLAVLAAMAASAVVAGLSAFGRRDVDS